MAVEMMNEPEAMAPECYNGGRTPVSWQRLGAFIRTTADAIRETRPKTVVTAGTLHVFLPQLWRADPRLDAVDIHVYHQTAGLPSRAELAAYVGDDRLSDPSLPLIAGECGMPDDAPVEEHMHLRNYLYNAERLRYDAAFVWRLETVLIDTRDPRRPHTEAGRLVHGELAARWSWP